jgi:hypothetical protein
MKKQANPNPWKRLSTMPCQNYHPPMNFQSGRWRLRKSVVINLLTRVIHKCLLLHLKNLSRNPHYLHLDNFIFPKMIKLIIIRPINLLIIAK